MEAEWEGEDEHEDGDEDENETEDKGEDEEEALGHVNATKFAKRDVTNSVA